MVEVNKLQPYNKWVFHTFLLCALHAHNHLFFCLMCLFGACWVFSKLVCHCRYCFGAFVNQVSIVRCFGWFRPKHNPIGHSSAMMHTQSHYTTSAYIAHAKHLFSLCLVNKLFWSKVSRYLFSWWNFNEEFIVQSPFNFIHLICSSCFLCIAMRSKFSWETHNHLIMCYLVTQTWSKRISEGPA